MLHKDSPVSSAAVASSVHYFALKMQYCVCFRNEFVLMGPSNYARLLPKAVRSSAARIFLNGNLQYVTLFL